MAARRLLVHSPLVGPATWDLVAADLARHGCEVGVPDLTGTVTAGPPYCPRQAEVIARSASGRPAILIGHSGAGNAGLPQPGSELGGEQAPDLRDGQRDHPGVGRGRLIGPDGRRREGTGAVLQRRGGARPTRYSGATARLEYAHLTGNGDRWYWPGLGPTRPAVAGRCQGTGAGNCRRRRPPARCRWPPVSRSRPGTTCCPGSTSLATTPPAFSPAAPPRR